MNGIEDEEIANTRPTFLVVKVDTGLVDETALADACSVKQKKIGSPRLFPTVCSVVVMGSTTRSCTL